MMRAAAVRDMGASYRQAPDAVKVAEVKGPEAKGAGGTPLRLDVRSRGEGSALVRRAESSPHHREAPGSWRPVRRLGSRAGRRPGDGRRQRDGCGSGGAFR